MHNELWQSYNDPPPLVATCFLCIKIIQGKFSKFTLTFKEAKTLILGSEKFQSVIIVVEMNPNMYDFQYCTKLCWNFSARRCLLMFHCTVFSIGTWHLTICGSSTGNSLSSSVAHNYKTVQKFRTWSHYIEPEWYFLANIWLDMTVKWLYWGVAIDSTS